MPSYEHHHTIAIYIAIAFLILQQLIVGLSTYFIASLAANIAEHRHFLFDLIGFICSLIIVYTPTYVASVYLEKAKFDVFNSYIKKFKEQFYAKTFLLNNSALKEQSTAFISQESKTVINDVLDFLFDGMALILNLFINIVILGFFRV